MNSADVINVRLANQHISTSSITHPVDVVKWLGGVQAQDYTAAKWAIGLRCSNISDEDIEQAFTDGEILRIHVLRPTWHFVLPADIRWMLALTAPRIQTISAYYYKQLGIDETLLKKSKSVLTNALQGNSYITRAEIGNVFQQAKIISSHQTQILAQILMYAELEGIICSGPRRGKQFTYALLDERVPQTNAWSREESLKELTFRYFQSRGPSTFQDFVWWSGLTFADAKKGVELNNTRLIHEVIGNKIYWFSSHQLTPKKESNDIYLLPNYDEYIVGYKDRQFIFDDTHNSKLDDRANPLFQHTILLKGKIIGTWKRTFKKDSVIISPNLFVSLNASEKIALETAIHKFKTFTI